MEILNRSSARALSQVRMVGNGINEIMDVRTALDQAEERGLDLILVSDTVTPPVVRIQDFNKIEYEKRKARKASRASAQGGGLKELKFKVNISDHDFGVKMGKIASWLEKSMKVKVMIQLKGRERENPERASDLLQRIGSAVECKFTRVSGPIAIGLLEPVKTSKKP